MKKQNWCWIELIGFDKDSPDYAVGEFLQRKGEKPDCISLLFMDLGFVLLHKHWEKYSFRPIDCAYGDKDCNEDRMRQAWTSTDLLGLICRLHTEGIKVYISFFNVLQEKEIGGWIFDEVREVDREGNAGNLVSMIKRFADGTSFADVFLPKVREVVADYGFDGVQFADGTSCARYPIALGDFTDDVVGRFIVSEGISDIAPICKNREEYAARRDCILEKYRYPFTRFLSSLWAEFYRKIHAELQDVSLVFNSYWTRDPFEALYRYGIDYRTCLTERDCLMVEEVSASFSILSEEDQCGLYRAEEDRKGYHYEFYLMQMALKCYLPTVRQITLTTIKDTTEQWDIIRQAPMELSKAVYRRNNGYVLQNGEFVRYSQGPLYCLSDGVPADNWRFLAQIEGVEIPSPQAPYGVTVLWSDDRLDRELRCVCEEKSYSATAIYNELLKKGLTVSTMARIEELDTLKTPLVIANPASLSAREREAVKNCTAPIWTVGYGKLDTPSSWEYTVEDFTCALYNAEVDEDDAEVFLGQVAGAAFSSAGEDETFGIWVGKIAYKSLPSDFFSALVDFVNKGLGLARVVNGRPCKITGFKRGDKVYLLLGNEEYYYVIPQIELSEKIWQAKSLTKIDGYKIVFDEHTFKDRIPPRGMDIVEITVEEK